MMVSVIGKKFLNEREPSRNPLLILKIATFYETIIYYCFGD